MVLLGRPISPGHPNSIKRGENMASIQKRGKTYQFTVSHMVNGKSKPIRKGGFRTKKEA